MGQDDTERFRGAAKLVWVLLFAIPEVSPLFQPMTPTRIQRYKTCRTAVP